MSFDLNNKGLDIITINRVRGIVSDSQLSAEQQVCAIEKEIAKFNKIKELFDKKYQDKGTTPENMKEISLNKQNITNEDCYAIFLDDNTFTIAYRYTQGVPSGIHHIHQIILKDLVSNNIIDIYSKASFEHQQKPYPIWLTKAEGIIENSTLVNHKRIYFIKLDYLINLDNKDNRKFYFSSPINYKIIQEIIGVANTYLEEHPLFVEETLLKRRTVQH